MKNNKKTKIKEIIIVTIQRKNKNIKKMLILIQNKIIQNKMII